MPTLLILGDLFQNSNILSVIDILFDNRKLAGEIISRSPDSVNKAIKTFQYSL